MYCGNCGNKIDDNAAFCPRCGASLRFGYNGPDTKSREKYTRIVKCIIGVILAVLSAGMIWHACDDGAFDDGVFETRGCEETAYLFVDSIMDNDWHTCFDLLHEKTVSELMEDVEIYDKEQLVDACESEMAEYFYYLKIGMDLGHVSDYTIDKRIISEHDYTDREIEEKLKNERWNTAGFTKSDVKKMRNLNIEVSMIIHPQEESGTLGTIDFDVANNGKEWYIIQIDFDE